MREPIYRLNRLLSSQRPGATEPFNCRMNAILKRDSYEFPCCVYTEQVAVRLAQTFHVPVAAGVLTTVNETLAFASLEVASPVIRLPDLLPSQFALAAQRYPHEAAGLTLFDIFIGNWDRERNLKAAIKHPEISLFRAFDHSHALLMVEDSISESLLALKSARLIVKRHPFYGHLKKSDLDEWLQRFAAIPEEQIRECCLFGQTVGEIKEIAQEGLADSLVMRRQSLPEIVDRNLSVICPDS